MSCGFLVDTCKIVRSESFGFEKRFHHKNGYKKKDEIVNLDDVLN